MIDLIRLYKASKEDFVAEVERNLNDISGRFREHDAIIEQQGLMLRELIAKTLARSTGTPHPTHWEYHAALPNIYFSDIYEPEIIPGGAKRWVGPSGSLEGIVVLPRTVQYRFEIQVVDFVDSTKVAAVELELDGKPYPWLDDTGRLYQTLIHENPSLDHVRFRVHLPPNVDVADTDVSFSFSRLALTLH